MGYLKAQHLVYPDSSVIEAVGYAVLPDDRPAEIIWVQTNFGKIYEYVAYSGDGKDYLAEFNKIAHGSSAGSAWHSFKRLNRPDKVLDPGAGEVWGEYELVLDEAPKTVEDTPVETVGDTVKADDAGTVKIDTSSYETPLRIEALAGALVFAQVTRNTNLDEVIQNASKILAYLKD